MIDTGRCDCVCVCVCVGGLKTFTVSAVHTSKPFRHIACHIGPRTNIDDVSSLHIYVLCAHAVSGNPIFVWSYDLR